VESGCVVRPDTAWDGYQVETSATAPFAPGTLRVFLAALRDLFAILGEAGLYAFENPMVSPLLARWKHEHLRAVMNSGAPEQAGIRGATRADSYQRPTAYFRLRGRQATWMPDIAQEPEWQIQDLLQLVELMAGLAHSIRDAVVLRLLRETGARLHEVLALSAGGCRRTGNPLRILVRNKGSLGNETKVLYLTPSTERLLHKYIRTDRARIDPLGRKRLAELDDRDPIFLARAGGAYTTDAFRYHWRQLLDRVLPHMTIQSGRPTRLTPHIVRHLHVTEALRLIRQLAGGDAGKLEDLQRAFQARMAWRSARMLDVYNLALDLTSGIETFQDQYVRVVESGRRKPMRRSMATARIAPPLPATDSQELLDLVRELQATS
jgi:hypothetical protein